MIIVINISVGQRPHIELQTATPLLNGYTIGALKTKEKKDADEAGKDKQLRKYIEAK